MERFPKNQRQRLVREIISAEPVRTQEELAEQLAVRGVPVTLDACRFPEIVGTVAGDDTIFIALRGPDDRPTVEGILQSAAPLPDMEE